ncbi:MAG: RHS repeat-associated core domain-containing protein, partial [Eubacteriales bacterium]
ELQDDLINSKELEWYDYGARFYDPQIGRWHVIDGLAENYYGHSPYHFTGNNPIVYIDPNGLAYYYSSDGRFLGDDGEDNDDIYTTNQDIITQNTNKNGEISWNNIIGSAGTEKIGVFGDFVNMNGYDISSDKLRQNLVGFSINMKSSGVTEEYSTIQVLSGDRSKERNKNAGGSSGSEHTKGTAADISVNGMSNEDLAYAAANYGQFGGVIFYPNIGDTQGFGTHQVNVISSCLYMLPLGGQYEFLTSTAITPIIMQNKQTLKPHVHVDMRSKPYLGRYAGNNGQKNTYLPWVSKTQIR